MGVYTDISENETVNESSSRPNPFAHVFPQLFTASEPQPAGSSLSPRLTQNDLPLATLLQSLQTRTLGMLFCLLAHLYINTLTRSSPFGLHCKTPTRLVRPSNIVSRVARVAYTDPISYHGFASIAFPQHHLSRYRPSTQHQYPTPAHRSCHAAQKQNKANCSRYTQGAFQTAPPACQCIHCT
jgi:hypothetical protein